MNRNTLLLLAGVGLLVLWARRPASVAAAPTEKPSPWGDLFGTVAPTLIEWGVSPHLVSQVGESLVD